jgi:hypothetical protein
MCKLCNSNCSKDSSTLRDYVSEYKFYAHMSDYKEFMREYKQLKGWLHHFRKEVCEYINYMGEYNGNWAVGKFI